MSSTCPGSQAGRRLRRADEAGPYHQDPRYQWASRTKVTGQGGGVYPRWSDSRSTLFFVLRQPVDGGAASPKRDVRAGQAASIVAATARVSLTPPEEGRMETEGGVCHSVERFSRRTEGRSTVEREALVRRVMRYSFRVRDDSLCLRLIRAAHLRRSPSAHG